MFGTKMQKKKDFHFQKISSYTIQIKHGNQQICGNTVNFW